MPWKVLHMSEARLAFCHAVRVLKVPLASAARQFGVSRKTAYKWLARFDARPADQPMSHVMADRPRRPGVVRRHVAPAVESAVLVIRDEHCWGPRKIHAVLRREHAADSAAGMPAPLPCLRTVANILLRQGRVRPTPAVDPATQRFERATPNELWQIDHKGPLEVQRTKIMPLTVLDDHSRYLLAFRPLTDRSMRTAFSVLWDLFGEVGMPASILCDNAFAILGGGGAGPVGGLSWFDAQLVKLGIKPIHGRPYHPQTQGKVEALHGSAMRELILRDARRDRIENFHQDCDRWRMVYNTKRPHEALNDEVPLSRWRPSDRRRPAKLPSVEYASDAVLRKVFSPGLIQWRHVRIRVGGGLIGEHVRIEETESELRVYYAFKQIRQLRQDQLNRNKVV